MNIAAPVGYRTKQQQVTIPGLEPFTLCSLLDRNQYSDPDGEAERLGISSAWWPLFGVLWPSSFYLAAELALRPVNSTEPMLEIGCGLALPSLLCHRRGMTVTASDHHPLAATFLAHNLALNSLLADLPYRYGHWGKQPPNVSELVKHPLLSERYDFIIGSDLLYERTTPLALSSFIDRHALAVAEVWIVDANRGYRAAFTRQMGVRGFVLYDDIHLNRKPCLSGAKAYKGQLLKYRRDRN